MQHGCACEMIRDCACGMLHDDVCGMADDDVYVKPRYDVTWNANCDVYGSAQDSCCEYEMVLILILNFSPQLSAFF